MQFRNPWSALAYSLLTALILSSCAKEHSPTIVSWSSSVSPVNEPQSDIVRALDHAWLTCDGQCPQGAGGLGMIALATGPADYSGRRDAGQCSGFLVAPNIVATNAHCLTPEIMKASDCGTVLGIKFLHADSKGVRTYACKKVLARSDVENEADGPDYGFFQIDAPERTPLRVARNGIRDQTWLNSVRVDPNSDGTLGGRITEASCHSAIGSLLNIRYTNEYSPTGVAVGCAARQGNSGSPVLDMDGEVVGILQSKKLDSYMNALRDPLRKLGVEFPPNPPNHFVFTNLSCVDDPETGQNLNRPNCLAVKEENILTGLAKTSFAKEADTKGAAKADAWQKRLPTFAHWKFSIRKEVGLISAHVRCLRPLADWPESMLATKSREGMLWSKKRYQAPYEAGLTLQPRLQLDGQLRFRNGADVAETTVPWKVELAFTSEGGDVEGFTEAMDPLYALKVPLITHWCSAAELAEGDDVSELKEAMK